MGDARLVLLDHSVNGNTGECERAVGVDRHQPARGVEVDAPLHSLDGYDVMPAKDVETTLLRQAGARPWDRTDEEIRVLFYIAEGRGEVIDSEAEVGGYPTPESTRAPFVESDWDLTTMRPRSGVWPGQKEGAQEHLSPRDREMRQTRR